jgi:sec-independent protein translocase protein TatB
MFGFSLSEMILLAVIALVVIGPRQLPEVARTLGRFINELKRTSNSFTREFRENMDKAKIEPIRFEDPKNSQTATPSAPISQAGPATTAAPPPTETTVTSASTVTPGTTEHHD